MVNNIKILKDNSKNIEVKEENAMFPLKIKCSECDSFKVCKSCEEGYYLTENGECLESCPSGTRRNGKG